MGVSQWIETTIGEQVTLQRGFDITRVEQNLGDVPVVSSSGIHSYHDTAAVKGPGVVLGRKGVVGSVYYVASDYWPHDTTLWVKDFHGNNQKFVYYFFKAFASQLANMDVGSANPTLNRNHVHPLAIHWPPLPEQRAIAHILGALDDKIELNRRMNQTLEAIARALFKSWFVDFDPVRAKAKELTQKTLKAQEALTFAPFASLAPLALNPAIADLFPDALVDSELGEIPKGWRVHALLDIIEINPPRQLSRGDPAPYLDMARMPTQGHSPESWIKREVGSGMRFKNGDTLVARITPCLENGKTAYVDFLDDEEVGWGSTEYIVLRPRETIPAVFAYLLARSNEFRTFAIQQMTGSSGRQRVPADSLAQYRIAAPVLNSPVFVAFGQAVDPLFERIRIGVEQSCTLAALRDTLLPKLISGELRVPEVSM